MFSGIAVLILFQGHAFGLASMSRMYNLGCKACHGAVPRTNYFGEKFMLRGYDLDKMTVADQPAGHVEIEKGVSCTECHNPGAKGDEVTAAKVSQDLFLHKVSNYLSARVKFTALELTANDQPVGSEMKTRVTLGKANWIQFWVAGPIAKNISVRAESELSDGSSVGLHNFAVAISDLFHSNGLLNIRFGGFAHGEWLSIPDQKRTFDPHFDIYTITSANGKGVDGFKVSGAEPAIEVYGYVGPVVHEIGISSGKSTKDPNKYKNYWGTLKLFLATKGEFAGSSISGQYLAGTDSNPNASQVDDFSRYIVSANLRYGSLDLYGTYVYGKDDNWNLATGLRNTFQGGFIQALYGVTPKLWIGAIYQYTDSDDIVIKTNHLLAGLNYYIRQNHLFSVYYDADLLGITSAHPYKKGRLAIQFRSNF